MRCRWNPVVCGVAIILLSACMQVPDKPIECKPAIIQAQKLEPDRAEQIIAFANWIERQPPEVLADLLQRDSLHRTTDEKPLLGDTERALVLSRPGTEFQDDQQALDLLQTARADAQANEQTFIALLQHKLRERQQQDAFWQQQLTQEKQKRRQLEQQLHDLKTIERDLLPRNDFTGGNPP